MILGLVATDSCSDLIGALTTACPDLSAVDLYESPFVSGYLSALGRACLRCPGPVSVPLSCTQPGLSGQGSWAPGSAVSGI